MLHLLKGGGGGMDFCAGHEILKYMQQICYPGLISGARVQPHHWAQWPGLFLDVYTIAGVQV